MRTGVRIWGFILRTEEGNEDFKPDGDRNQCHECLRKIHPSPCAKMDVGSKQQGAWGVNAEAHVRDGG